MVVVVSTTVSLVLTPLALRLAMRVGVLDRPGPYKAQVSPVPYLGGLAIVASFTALVVVAAALRPPVSGFGNLAILLGIGLALSVVGLVDDIRGLSPWLRLLLEVAAGIGVFTTGTSAQLLGRQHLDGVLTVAWIVAVVNAFNLLDNMDGLSAGVAAIASLATFAVALINDQFLVATLSLALVGCSLGFLRHNFHPARIYMGDAGSLYLGYLLAILTLRLRAHEVTRVSFVVPLMILGIAIFDTGLVTATRLLHRRPIFQGARDHTSHRLVFVGIPVPAAVALIYAVGVALGWLAVVASLVDRPAALLLLGLAAASGLFAACLLGSVPVYETSRRRRVMLREVLPHEEPARQPGSERSVP